MMILIHILVTIAGFFMMFPDIRYVARACSYRNKNVRPYVTTLWRNKLRLFLTISSILLSAKFFVLGLAVGMGRGISIAVIGLLITGVNIWYCKTRLPHQECA